MIDKPTGVFVRFPLSADDVRKMDIAIARSWITQENPAQEKCAEDGILVIGTAIKGGDIPVIITLGTLRDPIPCIRQSDYQAHAAALEAEVVRLQERYAAIRWRFIQDARIEGRTLTERQFDALVDNDDEAHKALKGGAA